MVEFCRRLTADGGKAEALRCAMLAKRVKYPNFVNRAAFALLEKLDEVRKRPLGPNGILKKNLRSGRCGLSRRRLKRPRNYLLSTGNCNC